jgi:hypothetical protein
MSGDPARARFAIMQLARIAGALIALAGVVVVSHRLVLPVASGDGIGNALVIVGVVVFFVAPLMLARRWKSRK